MLDRRDQESKLYLVLHWRGRRYVFSVSFAHMKFIRDRRL